MKQWQCLSVHLGELSTHGRLKYSVCMCLLDVHICLYLCRTTRILSSKRRFEVYYYFDHRVDFKLFKFIQTMNDCNKLRRNKYNVNECTPYQV